MFIHQYPNKPLLMVADMATAADSDYFDREADMRSPLTVPTREFAF